MTRNPLESIAAVTVEGATELAVGTDAVGSVSWQWFSNGNGLGFSSLELSRLAVWTASAPAIGWGTWNVSANGVDFQKLDGVFEGSSVKHVPGVGVGNDHAVAGPGKQDDAEGCRSPFALFDEIAVGRDANFMLRSPVCTASMSSDHGYHDAAFSQLPPWLAGQVAGRINQWIWRPVAVKACLA